MVLIVPVGRDEDDGGGRGVGRRLNCLAVMKEEGGVKCSGLSRSIGWSLEPNTEGMSLETEEVVCGIEEIDGVDEEDGIEGRDDEFEGVEVKRVGGRKGKFLKDQRRFCRHRLRVEREEEVGFLEGG